MARETRASNRDPSAGSTPGKRKRPAASPPPPLPSSSSSALKVVLPSPSSIAAGSSSNNTITSPEKDGDSGAKRQKISLKIKPVNGTSTATAVENEALGREADEVVDAVEDEIEVDTRAEDGDVKEESTEGALSEDVRKALIIVISQMAVNLPNPLDGILSLWLPPHFEQKKENTLGHVLKQKSLTWEKLVDVLHVFAENLLVPCSYPNPMPSLEQFHQPIPPLPAHYRPHVIYNFCLALHDLMLRIEPGHPHRLDSRTAEKWALMQKLPTSISSNTSAGEWFSSIIDSRMAESTLKGIKKEGVESQTLLENLAAGGDKFGMATPVSVQVMGTGEDRKIVPLSETLLKKASLKASLWKEKKATRKGGFGSISRGAVQIGDTSWTPSFAPSFDSSRATGGGSYYTQLDAMRERLTYNEWKAQSKEYEAELELAHGWKGCIQAEEDGTLPQSSKQADDGVERKLRENADLIDELSAWQEVRIRKGVEQVEPSSREHAIADTLLSSLSDLVSSVKPSDLIPSQKDIGFAHDLSQRFIPTPSPSIRGTLDPRRPQAIRDNLTVRPRPVTQNYASANGGLSTPQANIGGYGQSTPNRNYNYPSAQTPGYGLTGQTPYRPPTTPYAGYGAGQTPNNTLYGRPSPAMPVNSPSAAQAQYNRGPGPSNLRQSFGPVNGSPYGRNPAAGLMSQVGVQYR